MEDLFPTR